MYSMNRIPKTGDPCGRPHERSVCRPSSLSKWTCIDLPVVNEAIQLQRVMGHPCEQSWRISLPGSIPSKAPLISQVRREAVRPLLSACSISYIRHIVRSTADHKGRAPNYWLASTLW
jgi:hypothetical protein